MKKLVFAALLTLLSGQLFGQSLLDPGPTLHLDSYVASTNVAGTHCSAAVISITGAVPSELVRVYFSQDAITWSLWDEFETVILSDYTITEYVPMGLTSGYFRLEEVTP